jgi:NCS1 family nucleobase:cation symporter-1
MSNKSDTEGLEPISSEQRSMGLLHYIPVWWSSIIVVQIFAVAFFAVYPQGNLSVEQVILATIISALILGILYILNGFPGYEEGVPYAIQTRSAFGTKGSIIPNIFRIIPAIAWMGIGNWIAAEAIYTITSTLFGFGYVRLYFILFLILNILLAMEGVTSIKWFDSVAAGIIVVLLSYTAYVILTTQGISPRILNYEGSWGWKFIGLIGTSVGVLITGALNISDMSRHLENDDGTRTHILGHILGVAPAVVFMLLIGVLFGISAGSANPVAAVMEVAPTPLFGTIMLLFILFAQISTNLTLNILPPTHVFQDTLDISWESGVILTGILSIVTFPWALFTSSLFSLFINFYSIFLGAIVGVMLADYWIVRERELDVNALYEDGPISKNWYMRGFCLSGVFSLLIGTIASLPVIEVSWMVGLPVSFISYILLNKVGLDEFLSEKPSVSTGD